MYTRVWKLPQCIDSEETCMRTYVHDGFHCLSRRQWILLVNKYFDANLKVTEVSNP